ncbi:MAG TPA: PLP-dependent aminotransferase family protein, partial [Ramlibacter sp.]|nr:PLP-dependent aminotransferase family protein [Ramlibacter sp.]
RRGLVVGETGRGTFVHEAVPDAPPTIWEHSQRRRFIDLSHNFPINAPTSPALAGILRKVSRVHELRALMTYQVDLGLKRHRSAGAAWIRASGMPATAEEVVVTAGAQHGILLALSALARPGDVVMCEELTFYGLKSAAHTLGLTLAAVGMDAQGLLPQRLDEIARRTGSKVLYCMPTLHNPTTAIMSVERRQQVARICELHAITIIEDDVYGFLVCPRVSPLSSFVPRQSIYLTSLSKCIGPGLRIGYLRATQELVARIGIPLRASILMATPFMAEVASRLIRDGAADHIASVQRSDVMQRQTAAATLLPAKLRRANPSSFHIWLYMSNGWTARQFAREAGRRGVGVTPVEIFAVDARCYANAVRVCISAAHDMSRLRAGLGTL